MTDMLDYRLATALRGPDHVGAGPVVWKLLVTAPLRYLVALEYKVPLTTWCHGVAHHPDEAMTLAADDERLHEEKELLGPAQKFAAHSNARHVRRHATIAYNYLATESHSKEVKQLATDFKRWLREERLI